MALFHRNHVPPHATAPHGEDADGAMMQEPRGMLVVMSVVARERFFTVSSVSQRLSLQASQRLGLPPTVDSHAQPEVRGTEPRLRVSTHGRRKRSGAASRTAA